PNTMLLSRSMPSRWRISRASVTKTWPAPILKVIRFQLSMVGATFARTPFRVLSLVKVMTFFSSVLSRSLTEAAKEVSTGSTTGGFSSSLPVVLPPQAVSMETAMMPASIREAIFLSFIVIFSSIWCIKDRDPKQAERKVLSFQRHYSIPPPGVKARFTIFWFLLSFRYFGWKCEVYVWLVYAVILYIHSFLVRRVGCRRARRARIHNRSAGRMAPGKSDAQYI